MDPKIVLVSQRQGGHALASGYDRLQEYLDCRLIRPPARWNLAQRAAARVLRPVTRRSGSRWYHRPSLIGEIGAAREWLRGSGKVFHFLYGENSYRYLGLMKALAARNRIVCTYHTPPAKFSQVVTDRRHIERLDAAIVVSTMQLEFFAGILGRERVFFVPHGIDVDYFTPAARGAVTPRPFSCLFVGSHLRDIPTLAQAARLLAVEPDVRLVAVTRPANHAALAALDKVEVRSGLDDAQLLRAYQDADLLVLPLLDATANNSLLEAMACGLPIISTDLPGVRDYVNDGCAVLTPMADATALADAIVALKRDGARRARMAQASRNRAIDLSWENVARQTLEVYRAAGLQTDSGQETR
ncbi:MAG: glycosyltransferase family 4 protein [Gammaproteobacteria bacterium]|nr:glycosyltransferase family 4 protein [Gammaproteobacteria bacterium]